MSAEPITHSDSDPDLAAAPQPAAPAQAARPPDIMVPMPLGLMLQVGMRAHEAGRAQEAEAIASHLLRAVPQDGRVLHLTAIIAFRGNRQAFGIQLLEQAIKREPNNQLYYRNIAEMYRVTGRLEDALGAARRAIVLKPDDAVSYHNQAVILHESGQITEGLASSRRASALKHDMPGAHFAIAEAQLLLGEFAEGWEEYEWRFRMAGVPPLMPPAIRRERPQWGGGDLPSGSLMLIGDQGFGDVLQFSRYIPWAVGRGQPTFLATSKEMAPAIRCMFPDLDIRTRWADCADFAAYAPLSGLPRLRGTRLDTIPAIVPLPLDQGRAEAWAGRLNDSLPAGLKRVGIVWAGRPTHKNDRNRSIAFATIAQALGNLPGIALVSLQKGDRAADLAGYQGTAPLFDAAPYLETYEDTAAAIAALDLVVTVDTSVAHLTGIVGKTGWVLLPFTPDWRWLMGRTDSPWYPSLRLFRQQAPARWDEPLAAVAAELMAG
ncbi:glycosyltransferase [Acidisoma cellulosilytica]|uniref:Glycosyltransferase n=1 Tax=Acidisoma cellulosilyticum TaxID=2802395 RepID=A0A963YXK8_9PROT|nr:glycosyltransferase [Acidisoma cellulosilyticum]MCB8878944.1 glycosyltransferase [Acidisoma cellulosilyticum]